MAARVSAQGHELLSAVEAVLPAPELAAGRGDEKMQATAARKLVWLASSFGTTDLGICQRQGTYPAIRPRNGRYPHLWKIYPRFYPHQGLVSTIRFWTQKDKSQLIFSGLS